MDNTITKNIQLESVKKYRFSIAYIQNPDKDIQLEAVKQNGCAIMYVQNLDRINLLPCPPAGSIEVKNIVLF